MFYETFLTLCRRDGTAPTPLLTKLGISKGSVGKWQSGAMPNSSTLLKLSEYFNVSADYLLTGKERASADDGGESGKPSKELSEIEAELLRICGVLDIKRKVELLSFADKLENDLPKNL